jgi:hypothetical protein
MPPLKASGENSNRPRAAVLAAAVLAVVALLVAALGAATAQADPSPEAALAELNSWRAEVGVNPVATPTVGAWNTGCQNHNNYERIHGETLTHKDENGVGGHTVDGQEAAENSVLGAAFSSSGAVPDANLLPGPTWDAAVFHRAQLLQPRLAQTGFSSNTYPPEGGLVHSFNCMRTLGAAISETVKTPGLSLYPSPANGAYGVPTAFPAGSESPDPATETGVPAGAKLGWLLNVEINGPWATAGSGFTVSAHDVTATLAPDGTLSFVPLVVSECGPSGCGGGGGTGEGAFLQGGFGLFPTQPLAANTTYRVTLTGGTVTDQSTHTDYPIPAGYSWCFSTGASYAASADCAAPTTAAQEPSTPNASTAPIFTVPPAAGGGATLGPLPSTGMPRPHQVECVVPKLAGKSLKAAKKKLLAAHCKVGKVTRRTGPDREKGKAIHQSVKPGKDLPAGSKVAVTVDKG